MGDAWPAAILAFGTTAVLLPIVVRLSRMRGAIATPRPDRHSPRAVPTLGGLAIAGGIVVGIIAWPSWGIEHAAVLLGLTTMVALGLMDDIRYVSPRVRVLVEAATGIAFAIAVTSALEPSLRLSAVALTGVAVPVATNATNIVDNSDGLAASLSLITAVTLAGVAVAAGLSESVALLALVIAGACLAFLLVNAPPARIFMGDSGSLMLGFTLSSTSFLLVRDALLLSDYRRAAVAAAVPLAWSLQLGDLAMVVTTRLRRGVSPFTGGVDHTSHRLLAAGLGPRQTLGLVALLAIVVGSAAVASAALLSDYRLVAGVLFAGVLLVGLFEVMVARKTPQDRSG